MLRELLNKLSGGQITAIVLALIFVPGALGAAVTFQSVAIVDPTTGKQSYIDAGRKLNVFDPVAGYRNSPSNIVEVYVSNVGTRCETLYQYAIPSGKAFVITAVNGYANYLDRTNSGFSIYDGANCSGKLLLSRLSTVSDTNPQAPFDIDLGVGILVKPGKTISVFSIGNFGYTFLHGYLVPAYTAPASLAEAENEPKPILAEDVAAKLKRYKP